MCVREFEPHGATPSPQGLDVNEVAKQSTGKQKIIHSHGGTCTCNCAEGLHFSAFHSYIFTPHVHVQLCNQFTVALMMIIFIPHFSPLREAFSVSEEDNDIITEEIRRKILNLAQTFSAVVKAKGLTAMCMHILHIVACVCTYCIVYM